MAALGRTFRQRGRGARRSHAAYWSCIGDIDNRRAEKAIVEQRAHRRDDDDAAEWRARTDGGGMWADEAFEKDYRGIEGVAVSCSAALSERRRRGMTEMLRIVGVRFDLYQPEAVEQDSATAYGTCAHAARRRAPRAAWKKSGWPVRGRATLARWPCAATALSRARQRKGSGEPEQRDGNMSQRKVALITGGSAGIGKASALALAKAGWDVAVTGRRKELLDQVAAEARKHGGKAIGIVCDVGDPASVDALFAAVKAEFGRLDMLFNNAGVGAPPINHGRPDLRAMEGGGGHQSHRAFLCTQHAFRIMRDQKPMGGRIINNGSISAHAPRPNSRPTPRPSTR